MIGCYSIAECCQLCGLMCRLKGPWHEIFNLIFYQMTPPRPLTQGLKPFWIWLSIRRENRKFCCTAVSMTPLCSDANFDKSSAESLTPLWHVQQCHWHRCEMHRRVIDNTVTCKGVVIDTAVKCTEESLTTLWLVQRSHWHRCEMHRRVIDNTVTCTA
jgi:hypothetical protein